MNEKLQKDLSTLERLIGIQTDCIHAHDPSVQYMHGMLNGLICAHSVFADCEPKYMSKPHRIHGRNIRHKSMQSKGK
jgi:hypothetical protein